jgi:hypothetical protein
VNQVALIIKQARKHKMQGGYSKYSLCVNIFYRNSSQFTTKELSLDEATIPWQGHLKFRMCHPGKIKYGVLVSMVCEAVLGYICKIKIYMAEGQNLEDTVLSLLDRNLVQNHHISQAISIIV